VLCANHADAGLYRRPHAEDEILDGDHRQIDGTGLGAGQGLARALRTEGVDRLGAGETIDELLGREEIGVRPVR